MNVVETTGLGRRYGSTWALQDCTLALPAGRLVALIGPNGAGKSTLLNLIVGLTAPTVGAITRAGRAPGRVAGRARRDRLRGPGHAALPEPVGRRHGAPDAQPQRQLRPGVRAAIGCGELGISEKQKAGKLSGGQQAQLALSLALARHPRLLVLDEPTAPLDPLARHDFMASVMTAMAEDGISVVLSSHLLAELERVADHLVLIANGRVRIAGPVDELVAAHRLVTGPAAGGPRGPHLTPRPTGRSSSPARPAYRPISWSGSPPPAHPSRATASPGPSGSKS